MRNLEQQITQYAAYHRDRRNVAFGVSSDGTATQNESSWPGEIISLGNLNVQPGREGAILAWYAHIGERVKTGQVIGTLSRPTQTPDVVSMLAGQTEELSKMRTNASAERLYAETRIQQLRQLRIDTERTALQAQKTLSASDASSVTSSLVETKKFQARTLLRSTMTKSHTIMSGSPVLPASYASFQLKSGIGAQNSKLRDEFVSVFFEALSALDDGQIFPERSGFAFFDVATRLANASLSDGSSLSETDLNVLKEILTVNQGTFATLLGEIKTAELEVINAQKDAINKRADIDAEIASLEKLLAVSSGEVSAKETAYATVSNSLNNGFAILAPRSGIVSSIMKKPGEFVTPGMPIATVTSDGLSEKLIRFRIPNNVRKPLVGDMLSVSRPGFSSEQVPMRLIGIGSALDETGSYMADAVFVNSTDWPVGASVRVRMLQEDVSSTISLSAIKWNEKNEAYVWAVTSAGRVFAKNIVLGRTLGGEVEVYEGLKNGDRYIANPTPAIVEDMLIEDIVNEKNNKSTSSYEDMMRAMGM